MRLPKLIPHAQSAKNNSGNLLDLAIKAARKRATVGEISDALEKVYGRYKPSDSLVTGTCGSLSVRRPG